MGAYLSKPVTDKISCDESNESVAYGASSMQGWRVYQEDAHNAILNFGENQSLFAVYDGHGGHEVATYTAAELPNFIKTSAAYNENKYLTCLSDAFLEFDATLVEPEVLATLKEIAGSKDQKDSDYEGEEIDHLCREASMPLEEVMAKYSEDCCHHPTPMIVRPKKIKGLDSSLEEACSSKLLLNESFEETDSSLDSTINSSVANTSNVSEDEKKTQSHCPDSPTEMESPSSLHNGTPLSASSSKEEQNEAAVSSDTVNGKLETPVRNSRVNDEGGGAKEKKADLNKSFENEEELSMSLEEEAEQTRPMAENLDKERINGPSSEEQNVNGPLEENEDMNGPLVEKMVESGSLEEEKEKNGPSEETRIGCKGKGKGKVKGKAVISHAFVQAMKEVQRRAQKRKAAEKAEELYKQIHDAKLLDASDEDEDEDDDNFTGEKCNHGPVDNSSSEEDDSERDEDEEEEEEEEEEEDDEDENEMEDSQYHEFAMNMREEAGYDSGCTACVALLKGRELFVANVGDSRCVVSRNGKAVDMSTDHKPEDEIETERITKAGGRITNDGRVNGGLNLSRALGDHSYKQNKNLPAEEQMISPSPDVRCLTLTPEDSFIVIACDGIWNSMTSQEVCDFVTERMKSETKLSRIAEEIFDHCLSPDAHGDGTGCDNMTCIIIKLFSQSDSCGTSEKAPEVTRETGGAVSDSDNVKMCEDLNRKSEVRKAKEGSDSTKLNIEAEVPVCDAGECPSETEKMSKAGEYLPSKTEKTCEASADLPSETEKMSKAGEYLPSETEKTCEASADLPSETEKLCEASTDLSSDKVKACEASKNSSHDIETASNRENTDSESRMNCETNTKTESEIGPKTESIETVTLKESNEKGTNDDTNKAGCESVKRAFEATAESTDDDHKKKRCRLDVD